MYRGENTKTIDKKDRIKILISHVADSEPIHHKRDLKKLVDSILSEENSYQEYIISLFADCIENFSFKHAVYATAVILISLKNPQLSENIVETIIGRLQINLCEGNFIKAQSALLFIGELTNNGYYNSLTFANFLLEVAKESSLSSPENVNFYLYMVISVLPYSINTLREKSRLEFDTLCQVIEKVIEKRNTQYLELFKIDEQGQVVDTVDTLWIELDKIIKKDITLELKSVIRLASSFAEELNDCKPIKKFHTINLSKKNSEKCVYKPHIYLEIIEKNALDEESELIDQILLKNQVAIFFSVFNKVENIGREISKQINQYKHTFLMIEGIFQLLFQLRDDYNPLFLSSIVYNVLEGQKRDDPDKRTFQKAFSSYFSTLLQKSDTFTYPIISRFSKFFVNFIMISGFEIDWESWKIINDSEDSPKKINILKIIMKNLVRSTYYEKIDEKTPIHLKNLLPNKSPAHFEFEDPNGINHSDAEIIKDKINSKLNDSDMLTFLKSEDNNLEANGELLAEIFLQCFFNRTSKSLTHLDVTLERYKNTLKFLINNESDEILLLKTLSKFWQKDEFYVETYIDYFEEKGIIKISSIVDWIFSELKNETEENCYTYFLSYLLVSLPDKIIKREGYNKRSDANKQSNPGDKSNLDETLASILKKYIRLINEAGPKSNSTKTIYLNGLADFIRNFATNFKANIHKFEDENSKIISVEVSKLLSFIKVLV